MKNKKTEKSTLLLVLFLFLLFNAAQLFRTSMNTMYFTEDTSSDYASVEATVTAFKPDTVEGPPQQELLTPVFSFLYKDKEMTMAAPELAFAQERQKNQPFQQGEVYTLWVHKRWGKLIMPPLMGPKELGGTQLRFSALFLILAVAIWIFRNKMAKKDVR